MTGSRYDLVCPLWPPLPRPPGEERPRGSFLWLSGLCKATILFPVRRPVEKSGRTLLCTPLSLLRCPASRAARRRIDFSSGRVPVAFLACFILNLNLFFLYFFTGGSDSASHGTNHQFGRDRVVRRMQPSCDCSATSCERSTNRSCKASRTLSLVTPRDKRGLAGSGVSSRMRCCGRKPNWCRDCAFSGRQDIGLNRHDSG
ncbi:hypothetical protein LZ30DRAFT_197942 [Colletotrichum cereale]|nr:hypothetical protein LZ30DRAFT_197942 [Colletotrichum cereale]